MFKLALYQYKEDIKKISFTRFLKEEKNISLSDAKNSLDKFLNGIPLLFLFNSRGELQRFKRKAESLGAISKEMKSQLFVEKSELKKRSAAKNQSNRKSFNSAKSKEEYSEVLMLN